MTQPLEGPIHNRITEIEELYRQIKADMQPILDLVNSINNKTLVLETEVHAAGIKVADQITRFKKVS